MKIQKTDWGYKKGEILPENTVTDLKMSRHFLFNTLNQMASMALEGGGIDLYQSIIYLSRMFHYTSQEQGELVSLKKELNYVESYLQLQKFRYKNTLEFYFDIDDKVQDILVPFNFLQPLVEHAFVHGCEGEQKKIMKLQVRSKKEDVEIRIISQGKVLAEQECWWKNAEMKGDMGYGLRMVYHKLETFYGTGFSMKMYLREGSNVFLVKIPSTKG